MNTDPRLELRVAAALNRAASTREPAGLLDSVLTTVGRTRTRPRWLALIKEPPMRIHSRVAVGSPTARLAYLFLITLMLTVIATGAVVAGASLLPGTVIVVAQDGTGTVRTITEAVAMAVDGDTILVRPGTYNGSVAITTDITLRGDGDRTAIVLEFSADGPKHALDIGDDTFAYGILLDGSDARVENLTVRGPAEAVAFHIDGGAPVIDGVGIVLDGDPWGVDGWYYKRSAFRIQGGSTAQIHDSTWDGYSVVQGWGANSPTFEGNLIAAMDIRVQGGSNQPVIRRNTFLQGAVYWPDSGSGGIAEGNDIVGCITVAPGNDPIIRGNRIRGGCGPDPGSAAISVEDPSAVVVVDNEITNSPYGIQVAGGAAPEISRNTIRGSVSAAIVVDNGASPTMHGNVIEGNSTGILVRGITTAPVMTDNRLCENGTDLAVPDGSTLTLAGNTICGVAVSAAP